MGKLEDAKEILKDCGMPVQQQNDISAYTLLTLAEVDPEMEWAQATNSWKRIHDVLEFASEKYEKTYAENTRETIRKNCMHQFREGAIVEDNGKATNSPNYRYRITYETLELIRSYNTESYVEILSAYLKERETLVEKYTSKKQMEMMLVKINQEELNFSPGKHNELQKAIIENFAPRFAPNAECLYVGDTIKKDLIKNVEKLSNLGFEITLHDKMPDVVLYCEDKNWIYFIEAVTSVGPMSPQRIIEIEEMTKGVKAGKIYITAFPDFLTYKKFSEDLAWETEVWLSDLPDHMIHLNGDKFMGPREKR
ncbi:MAG: restriction endonuclease [Lachnospiraceae bacterium]|nr:restriction endonuclease [Lachnospiraceae bacterium]